MSDFQGYAVIWLEGWETSHLCYGFGLFHEFSLPSNTPLSLTPLRVPDSGSHCCGAVFEMVNSERG